MNIKPLSDDTYAIFENAAAQAQLYFHNFCGSNHIFLSLFSFLSKNKETERYKGVYTTLKKLLNDYNVDGKKFQTSFLTYCPRGEAVAEGTEFEITADNDYNAIRNSLKRRALSEKRSREVEDLIAELFSDQSYAISTVLADIVGSDMKSDELRNKIVQAFKKRQISDIKELSDLPELKNINLWVKDHPQKIIGADEDIQKVEMALAGRSIKNAVITGPAGTGKTSIVYELAQRINSGNVPEFLKDKIIYERNSNARVAGTR